MKAWASDAGKLARYEHIGWNGWPHRRCWAFHSGSIASRGSSVSSSRASWVAVDVVVGAGTGASIGLAVARCDTDGVGSSSIPRTAIPGRSERGREDSRPPSARARGERPIGGRDLPAPRPPSEYDQRLSTTIVAGADSLPASSTAMTVYVLNETGVPYRMSRSKPTTRLSRTPLR